MSKQVLYYGTNRSLPTQQPLRAGPLTAIFEAGDLRYIRLGETEVLRRLYWAVRDRNWGTPPLTLSNLEIQDNADSFSIHYDAVCQQGEIDFRAKATIQGDATGEIRFGFSGVAHSGFYRNRLGFCVLHPMLVAGAPARITHVDGKVEEQRLPLHIASQFVINGEIKPVIPFNEMRSLAHEISPGRWAEVSFEGEIFEMEDQRNWTDASFKTYCIPLRLPFPVEVKEGTTVAQSITLRLLSDDKPGRQSKAAKPSANRSSSIHVTVDSGSHHPLPKIGLGVASHEQALNQREIQRLQRLHLAHLRVDLPLAQTDYPAKLKRAITEANALGVKLEIALHLSDNAQQELSALSALLSEFQPPVAAWLIFHQKEKVTTPGWVTMARQTLADYSPATLIGAGTNIYFTELNSRRPSVEALEAMDAVAWSVNPQVHAFDNSSLVETLAAQAVTATSARQFCGDRPLLVTPITLQPRFNPNATGPEPELKAGELPSQVDPRQMSLFGAGWTLASIKQLAQSGEVSSLTYYETTGWRGVMERSSGSPLPEKFQSLPGVVFPLYYVFADVGEFAGGGEVLSCKSQAELSVEALALHKEGRTRILLTNFTASAQSVTLQGINGATVRVRLLDERNVMQAMRSPATFQQRIGSLRSVTEGKLRVELLPFALARIDVEM